MAAKVSPAHEAKCRRCGRCCYEKYIVDGRVFTTRRPCPYLNVKTRLCTVYEQRFAVNPRCLSVEAGIECGVFPADCLYIRGRRGYQPSEEGWLDAKTVKKIERGTLTRHADVLAEMRRAERMKRAARGR